MVKLQKTKGRYFLSMPKDIVKKMGWKKGTELFVNYNPRSDVVEIEKMEK